jgi:hypothetical protein
MMGLLQPVCRAQVNATFGRSGLRSLRALDHDDPRLPRFRGDDG